jgi:hypothetical protein
VWTGNDWTAARAFLIKLYASADEDSLITSDKLRAWIKKHTEKGIFEHLRDIDKYYRKFITQADYLLSRSEILQRDVNLLFYQGIPEDIRKKVRKRLPSINQKISNPPDVDVTLGLLRQEFDETDINTVVRGADLPDVTDDDPIDSDANRAPRVKTKKSTVRFGPSSPPVPAQTPVVEPTENTDADALHRELQELSAEKQRLLQEIAATRTSTTASAELQSCFICDGVYIHRLGIQHCPETQQLISEGLAIFSPIGRLVRPDGTDLPGPNMIGHGGLAKFLRHELRSFSTHSSQVANVQFDGHNLLDHNIYAIPTITPVSRFSTHVPSTSTKYERQIPPSTTPQDFQDQPPRRRSIHHPAATVPDRNRSS